MEISDTSMRLPIRLLPRRGGQIFRIFFFLFFFGFAILWTTMASTFLFQAPVGNEPMPGFRYIFPAFGIPFLVVGLVGLASALLKLLPGSPYYYVELAPDGIATRKGWQIRRFAWTEISPFGVAVKVRRGKGGTTRTYWVVALRAADAARLADESQRYNRSVLQIDAGQYGANDADMAASVLSDWLNQLKAEAVAHPGRLPDTSPVPPDFRGRAIAVASAAMGSALASQAPRRSSVIER
jgi:hypothetical protein